MVKIGIRILSPLSLKQIGFQRINTAKGKTLKITSKSPQLQKKFLYKKQLIFIKGRLGAKKGLAIPDDPPQLFLFGVIFLNLGSPIIQVQFKSYPVGEFVSQWIQFKRELGFIAETASPVPKKWNWSSLHCKMFDVWLDLVIRWTQEPLTLPPLLIPWVSVFSCSIKDKARIDRFCFPVFFLFLLQHPFTSRRHKHSQITLFLGFFWETVWLSAFYLCFVLFYNNWEKAAKAVLDAISWTWHFIRFCPHFAFLFSSLTTGKICWKSSPSLSLTQTSGTDMLSFLSSILLLSVNITNIITY